jgi:hypothetical protein
MAVPESNRPSAAEYNALRVLFQKESYCLAFIETVCPGWLGSFSRELIEVDGYELERAKKGWRTREGD